jgi:hypothetical protein
MQDLLAIFAFVTMILVPAAIACRPGSGEMDADSIWPSYTLDT